LKVLVGDVTLLTDMMDITVNTPSLPSLANHLLRLVNSTDRYEGTFTPSNTLVVLNKTDLMDEEKRQQVWEIFQSRCGGAGVCAMSCKTGDGVEVFMEHLEGMLRIM
jgi:GTPase involved in cell partitioning and DNA repair